MSVRTPARIPNDADRMNALTKASPMLRAGVISIAGLLTLSLLNPAHAHHPFGMGDSTDLSALQGLLSGIGHPLLGPDHLLFLLAIAFIGLQRPQAWAIPLAGCWPGRECCVAVHSPAGCRGFLGGSPGVAQPGG